MRKTSVRKSGSPAEIRNAYLPNTSIGLDPILGLFVAKVVTSLCDLCFPLKCDTQKCVIQRETSCRLRWTEFCGAYVIKMLNIEVTAVLFLNFNIEFNTIHDEWILVTTAWRDRRLRMEETASRCKEEGESKGKAVLVLNGVPRHKDVLGEWTYNSTHSTSALDGGEWSA